MPRYVLLPRSRSISSATRRILKEQLEVEVVDECAGRALLVEATEDAADNLSRLLGDCIVARESAYPRSE